MASPHTNPLLGAAGAVATAGGAFIAVENAWSGLGFALVTIGLAAVAIALWLHFRKARGASAPAVPESATFRGVDVGGRSRLDVDSSAENLAVDTRFTDDAQVTIRHRPGQPDMLGEP